MSSYKNLKHDVPPPYDQATSVDIDSGTAPLLHETFSGSIFGTSTIVTFELATGSYPSTYWKSLFYHQISNTFPISVSTASNIISELFEKAQDYTFVVRDFLGCVQANGKVANCSQTLDTTLKDVWGNEIIQFRKQVSIEPPRDLSNVIMRFISRVFNQKKANTVHTFEITKNGVRIGLVTYGDKEPPETCLKIYFGDGNNEFVVKSLTRDEFIVSYWSHDRFSFSKKSYNC